jgi:hypothetical protein
MNEIHSYRSRYHAVVVAHVYDVPVTHAIVFNIYSIYMYSTQSLLQNTLVLTFVEKKQHSEGRVDSLTVDQRNDTKLRHHVFYDSGGVLPIELHKVLVSYINYINE